MGHFMASSIAQVPSWEVPKLNMEISGKIIYKFYKCRNFQQDILDFQSPAQLDPCFGNI